MDLKDLELFLCISRFGSINKAAESLFLAQSTVTHRVKQLERELNSTLFIRTSGGVVLTPEGKQFVPIASSICEQMKSFTNVKAERPITIAAGKAFASYELPRLLGAYRNRNPLFTCYVKSTLFDQSVHSLLSGAADAAMLGSEIYHPSIKQVMLPSDRIVLLVSPKHEWANEFPGFDHWGAQEVIAFGDSSAPFRNRIDRFLAEKGVYPNIIMELDSISAVKQMVMQNLGVAFLPERTMRDEVASGKLSVLDVAKGRLTRPTLIAYPTYKEEDKDFMRFVNWMVSEY